jgi:hypothetical protein
MNNNKYNHLNNSNNNMVLNNKENMDPATGNYIQLKNQITISKRIPLQEITSKSLVVRKLKVQAPIERRNCVCIPSRHVILFR